MKWNKILIRTFDVTDAEAIDKVKDVISEGRISEYKSGKGYCAVTKYSDGIIVDCDKTKTGTDVFRVFRQQK